MANKNPKEGRENFDKATKAQTNRKGKKGLNDRMKAFVMHYFATNDGAGSAVKAGYSEKTAKAKACDLLKDSRVQAELDALRAERRKTAVLTFEQRAEILSNIATGKVSDFLEVDGDGKLRIDRNDLKGAALSQVDQKQLLGTDGGALGVVTKIRLRDPVSAIKELNAMFGDHAPKRVDMRTGQIDDMTEDEALAELDRIERDETEASGEAG